jgi:hypothetical protein
MEIRIKRFSFESLARKYYRSSKKVKGEILDEVHTSHTALLHKYLCLLLSLRPLRCKSVRGFTLCPYARSFLGSSPVRPFIIAAIIVLVIATSPNVEARVRSLEVKLPGVDGWQIMARDRLSSVSCSGTKIINGIDLHVIADKGGYQGGVWFLSVTSHHHRLKAGLDEAEAKLLLNSRSLVVGKALSVSDRVGKKRTSTYTRFEFPAIDSSINDLETPGSLEIKAEGIDPIALESLSPIISALKNCHQDSSEPDFWKNAEEKCN